MASISLAIGMSHGPMLAIDPELWLDRAEGDYNNKNPDYNTLDGRFLTYKELVDEVGSPFESKANLENFYKQHKHCNEVLDRLADELAASKPDVVLMIGNDQVELFRKSNHPALAIFYGDTIKTFKRNPEGMPLWRQAVSEAYAMDEVHEFPGAPKLGLDIIKSLIKKQFDIGAADSVPEPLKLGFGHAYGYVFERIYGDLSIPTLPVLVNTFCPPNVPTIQRCFDFGKALRESILENESEAKIAVIATGGLSHFICEEEFDRKFIKSMVEKDFDTLLSFPEESMQSGSSENRSWVTLAGLLGDLENDWVDYTPIHRTAPGTGQGMGFGVWK